MWEKYGGRIIFFHRTTHSPEETTQLLYKHKVLSPVFMMHVCMHLHTEGSGWFFDCSLPYHLRQVLLLNLELAYWLGHHASEFQGWGYRLAASCPAFYVSAEDPKWIPHACMAGTYWQPICHIFNGSLPQRGISKNLSFCWSLPLHSSTESHMHGDLIIVILVLKGRAWHLRTLFSSWVFWHGCMYLISQLC